jgi:hypothetical protein
VHESHRPLSADYAHATRLLIAVLLLGGEASDEGNRIG